MRVTSHSPVDVLILHDRPFDERESFKKEVVAGVHAFVQRAPWARIRESREDPTWDLGADANLSLVSVVLATPLEDLGVRYKVWDMDNLLSNAGGHVARDLRSGPRIIAVSSSHFSNATQFSEFVAFVRRHNAQAPLVVGGQLLENAPEIESHVPDVDYYVHGDGEATFGPLVRSILAAGGATPVDLPGVRCRENGVYRGSRHWQALDINTTPVPRWDLTLTRDFNNYAPKRSPLNPMVFVEESRGCLHRCAFCAYPRTIPARLKSPDRILSELEQYVGWGLRHFNFYSALFTFPADHCREILRKIIDAGLDITFSCQGRADDLYRNPFLVDLLKQAGCVHISVGIESGDASLLKRMGKPLDVFRIPDIVQRIHRAGISICGNFFIGFPGETAASIQATYDLIGRCDFETLYLSTFVVEEAAEVGRNREKYGLEVSEDGKTWRHATMGVDEAELETRKIFYALAEDSRLRTVLWVVQWRFARLFPRLLLTTQREDAWEALRLMQRGVVNEMRYAASSREEDLHETAQRALWERIATYRTLFDEEE